MCDDAVMSKSKKPQQPKVRSPLAVAAYLRGGAGKHGGSDRARNRRDRQAARRDLRNAGDNA